MIRARADRSLSRPSPFLRRQPWPDNRDSGVVRSHPRVDQRAHRPHGPAGLITAKAGGGLTRLGPQYGPCTSCELLIPLEHADITHLWFPAAEESINRNQCLPTISSPTTWALLLGSRRMTPAPARAGCYRGRRGMLRAAGTVSRSPPFSRGTVLDAANEGCSFDMLSGAVVIGSRRRHLTGTGRRFVRLRAGAAAATSRHGTVPPPVSGPHGGDRRHPSSPPLLGITTGPAIPKASFYAELWRTPILQIVYPVPIVPMRGLVAPPRRDHLHGLQVNGGPTPVHATPPPSVDSCDSTRLSAFTDA